MDRRSFLKFLLSTPIAATLDVEKMLWIPGEKKIFIPSGALSLTQIIAIEMERMLPNIRLLFERDDVFYKAIENRSVEIISSRPLNIPSLVIKK